MSPFSQLAQVTCAQCGAELPPATLACPQCNTLVHSARLDQLAEDARALENKGGFAAARELWETALTLLPPDSKQAGWVHDRLRALQNAEATVLGMVATGPEALQKPAQNPNWIKRLGPLGPLALLLLKLKTALFFLLKLKFLFSFILFIGLYVGLFGWRYGLGISAAILIHEMGHYIDIKRRGLPAEMPVFLPGLGAYVRWTNLGVTRRQIAQISLAGPLAGWIAAAICFLLYTETRDPLWAALARTGAVLNTLNLIPVWVLDGGQAVQSIGLAERVTLLFAAVGCWFYTGEGLFLFVAAGFAWATFTAWRSNQEQEPAPADWSTWAYYGSLLAALAILLHATPNTLLNHATTN